VEVELHRASLTVQRHTIKSAMPSTSAPQSHPDVPDNLGMTEGAATSKLTIADLKPFIPTVSSDVVFLDQWSEKRSHESMLRSMKVVDKFKLLHETINPTRLGGMMKDIKPKTPSTRLQSMMSDRRSEEGGISDEDVEDLVSHLASSIKIHFAGKAAEAGGDEISEFGRYCSSLPEYIVLVRGGRAIDGLH
jgi:hypothetical protein